MKPTQEIPLLGEATAGDDGTAASGCACGVDDGCSVGEDCACGEACGADCACVCDAHARAISEQISAVDAAVQND